MRVKATSQTFQPFPKIAEQVHEKADSGSFQQQSQQQAGDERRRDDDEAIAVNDEKVTAAMDAFTQDNQTRHNGLTATASGTGPGLQVTLKDGSGKVVRQMTGEEFLKLRESVAKSGKGAGKILDQKL
ncbi:MAG: hypothetical protein AB7P04_10820 [Bacteriovoracia bacterium]